MSSLPDVSLRRHSALNATWVIARREISDSLHDWRILTPIIILTLVFPFLMDFTSRWATNWVSQFANPILMERLNPFLLMIVGFFPISFSLIIALESFVGEKERNSIEPILSMPLSDLELYLGKMLSSLLLPLGAAYLGISVFLLMRLSTSPAWVPGLELTLLMIMLTTMEAFVMVCGAVVVSSQTTSVRAANLLASFIIIPMALLLQAESIIMFYAEYHALWWFVAGLFVVTLILIRMGIRTFNREDILSKETDELNLKNSWLDFKGYFLRPPELATQRANPQATRFNLFRFYRHDIPILFQQQQIPLLLVLGVSLVAVGLGAYAAHLFPAPAHTISFDNITPDTFTDMQRISLLLPSLNTMSIFSNNIRVIVLAGLLSVFSFGALALLLVVANIGLVSFVIAQMINLGVNPGLFMLAFILPHGIFEIPALLIGLTFAMRIGAALMSPPYRLDIGQSLLYTTANFVKVTLFLVLPMLLLAAFIEANVTPQVVLFFFSK
jgi:uncharacterized membrane protein SpoIIM required for sporulation/ABC-type transport system involved in multi-copper enzyme maturation permease subunit